MKPRRPSFTRRLGHLGADLGMVVASLVAVVVAGVVLLTSGSSRPAVGGGVPGLVALTALSPTGPAPALDRADPDRQLALAVAGLRFPNWQSRGGWRASGSRTVTLSGRRAVSVYYTRAGAALTYAVAAPPALPWSGRGSRYVWFRSRVGGARTTLVWWYEGHTCALSAVGLSRGALQRLAQATVV